MQFRRGCMNDHWNCSCQCEGFGRSTRLAVFSMRGSACAVQHARLLETAARQRGRVKLHLLLLLTRPLLVYTGCPDTVLFGDIHVIAADCMGPRILAVAAVVLAMCLLASAGQRCRAGQTLFTYAFPALKARSMIVDVAAKARAVLRSAVAAADTVHKENAYTGFPSHLHRWAPQKAQASLATP
eukprot:366458-Chlamydomonas_euryale.AAC.28